MKWRLLLVLLAPLVMITPARAADWQELGSNSTMTVLVDLESIGPRGKLMRAWFMYDYKKSQPGPRGKPFRSMKTLVAFNCSDRTLATVQTVVYGESNGRGDTLGSRSTPWELLSFEDAIPETLGEEQLEGVCQAGQSK